MRSNNRQGAPRRSAQEDQSKPEPKQRPSDAPKLDLSKLITSSGEFCYEGPAQVLSESSQQGFCVIGIVGQQGTGKSLLANILLGLDSDEHIDSQGCDPSVVAPSLSSHAVPRGGDSARASSRAIASQSARGSQPAGPAVAFPTRGATWPAGIHCTVGVDIRASPYDRTIVIDTQPLLSASVLGSLAEQSGTSHIPLESLLHRQALQLVTFLLSACNIVVIMLDASDPSGEAQIWQLLQAAEMFVPSVPDVTCGNTATATQMGQETIPSRTADVVFVSSNEAAVSPFGGERLRRKRDLLAAVFANSSLLVTGMDARPISISQLLSEASEGESDPSFSYGSKASQTVHFWALPGPSCGEFEASQMMLRSKKPCSDGSVDGSDTYQGEESYCNEKGGPTVARMPHRLFKQLAGRLLRQPCRQFARQAATERDWLKGCQRAWAALSSPSGGLREFSSSLERSL